MYLLLLLPFRRRVLCCICGVRLPLLQGQLPQLLFRLVLQRGSEGIGLAAAAAAAPPAAGAQLLLLLLKAAAPPLRELRRCSRGAQAAARGEALWVSARTAAVDRLDAILLWRET